MNKLKCKFQTINSTLRGKLLQTYCCSWYGCQIWDLVGRSVKVMNTEWNKAVRRTMNLHYKTHTCLLPLLISGKSFADQHRSRVSNFLASFCSSGNDHVLFIGERARHYSYSALGRNFTRCKEEVVLASPSADLTTRCQAITELLDIKDGLSILNGVSLQEVDYMIETLCCS